MRTALARVFAVFVLLLFLGALGWVLTGVLRFVLVAVGVLLLLAWLGRAAWGRRVPR